jgi:hypothetical protein
LSIDEADEGRSDEREVIIEGSEELHGEWCGVIMKA